MTHPVFWSLVDGRVEHDPVVFNLKPVLQERLDLILLLLYLLSCQLTEEMLVTAHPSAHGIIDNYKVKLRRIVVVVVTCTHMHSMELNNVISTLNMPNQWSVV